MKYCLCSLLDVVLIDLGTYLVVVLSVNCGFAARFSHISYLEKTACDRLDTSPGYTSRGYNPFWVSSSAPRD